MNIVDNYSNAGGYGIFCGKKCIAEKKAQGIPPKRGAKNIAEFQAEQSQNNQLNQQYDESVSSNSSTPLIIGGVLLLGVVTTIILVIRKRNKNK